MSEYILSIDLGLINFSYCLIEIVTEKIIKWDVIVIGLSTDTYEKSCSSLASYLTKLDLTKLDLNNNKISKITVVVELQPHVNVKTLVMSGQVQMYYVLEKAKNKYLIDNSYCKIEKIVGYHARNKLKYYEKQDGDEPLDLSSLKNSYYKNKKMSKEHCKRVLIQKNETEWSKFLEKSKKKDDLADSALMGFAYIKFVMGLSNSKKEIKEKEEKEEKEEIKELDNPEKYPKKIPNKFCAGLTKKGLYCKIHKT